MPRILNSNPVFQDQSGLNEEELTKDQKIALASKGLSAAMSASGAGGEVGGAAQGALAGFQLGGVGGAVAGGLIGGGLGIMRSRAERKKAEIQAQNQKLQQLAEIEGRRAYNINNAIGNMAERLSAAFRVPTFRA